jgi:hypothetical protein
MGIRGDNMAWQTPKTNWDTHPKAIEPEDINRIEGNILGGTGADKHPPPC